MTQIKPLGKRILIKPIPTEEKTKSGIILPETAIQDKPEYGTVLAVGKDVVIEIVEGDVVLFSKYKPVEINIDDTDYLLSVDEDILAVIKSDEKI